MRIARSSMVVVLKLIEESISILIYAQETITHNAGNDKIVLSYCWICYSFMTLSILTCHWRLGRSQAITHKWRIYLPTSFPNKWWTRVVWFLNNIHLFFFSIIKITVVFVNNQTEVCIYCFVQKREK